MGTGGRRSTGHGRPLLPSVRWHRELLAQAKRSFRKIGTKVILSGSERDLMSEARDAVLAQPNKFASNCAQGGIDAILHIRLPGEGIEDC